MARISSYPRDREVQDEDSWIGTESSNRITRNFSAKAIAEYLNINGKVSISSQMVFQLDQGTVSDGQFNGVFTDNPFSAASSLVISHRDMSTQEVVAFLDYLVGSEILISEQKEISNFGHYEITSYTLIPLTTTYTLNLTYIGGNGAFEDLKYYDFATFTISSRIVGGVTGSGTLNTIPIFTGPTTIGDSFMTYDPASQFFNISKRLSVTGDLTAQGRGSFSGAYLRVSCPLQDGSNLSGTAGQVLSSTGTGVEWVDPSSSITKLIPYFQTATPGGSDTYTQSNNIVDFDWSGGSGTYEYILPSATAIQYRKIRFVNNSTISASTKVRITAPIGETIDGGAFYEINKSYNGCAVWSDGVQWIVIQAKA